VPLVTVAAEAFAMVVEPRARFDLPYRVGVGVVLEATQKSYHKHTGLQSLPLAVYKAERMGWEECEIEIEWSESGSAL
jgi:hypothetical protein